MNYVHTVSHVQQRLEKLLREHYNQVFSIVKDIEQAGGSAYLVGGAVRDLILGIAIYDMDIEVHGLTIERLTELLSNYGPVSLVGKSFGVLKFHNSPIDWSLPRTDSAGRKPQVTIDPLLTIKDALARRDLTMNAIAINLSTYELIDPFNGYKDIQEKILRSPDTTFFAQDPLRFYRVMQFISRFEMQPDIHLNNICKTMDISTVSKERIEAEFDKLMLKSVRPSLGIRWLCYIKRLAHILPELAATEPTEQEPEWHPEGTVFEHTMQAVDASAVLEYTDTHEKLIIMYAALCHDLGKAVTTQCIKGRLRSLGHAQAGVPLAQALLKRITRRNKLIDTVKLLVNYHMEPLLFVKQKASLAAYKRLALKLAPEANLAMLAKLSLADRRGRNGKGHEPLTGPIEDVNEFVKRAQAAGVLTTPEAPLLQGADIMHYVKPGPLVGKILRYAYELQMKWGIKNKEELKQKALAKFDITL